MFADDLKRPGRCPRAAGSTSPPTSRDLPFACGYRDAGTDAFRVWLEFAATAKNRRKAGCDLATDFVNVAVPPSVVLHRGHDAGYHHD
jgi:hypothetical protein